MIKGSSLLFWLCWCLDAIAGLIVSFFFFSGLADGTIGSDNGLLWLLIMLIVCGVLLGSIHFRREEKMALSWLLIGIMLLPALLFLIIVLIAMFGNVRWN